MRFWLVRIVVAALFVALPVVVIQLAAQALGLDPLTVVPLAIAAAPVSYVAYTRLVEQRSPPFELARGGAVAQTAVGFAIGAGLFSATMLALWLLGVAAVSSGAGPAALVTGLVASLGAAVVEEILFRGILFRIVSERLGDAVALAVSAALFGAVHAANPGATAASSVAIALEAGVLLGAAYMVTRQLWLPIGMHWAWNFTEGGVFGASVSGHEVRGLFTSHFSGPDLLTGGTFGPEASIVAVLVCLLAAAALLVFAARRPGARRT